MLPKRLSRRTIHQSPWINLHVDRVQMPSGKIIEGYHFVDFPKEFVITLFTNQREEVCFVKVYRYQTQKLSWELPAGGIEDHEKPVDAAAREAFEESGYQVHRLRKTYEFNLLNGISNAKMHLFFGEVKGKFQTVFDENEVKEVAWFSQEKVKEMIQNNEILDVATLTALLFYLNQGHRKK